MEGCVKAGEGRRILMKCNSKSIETESSVEEELVEPER
jgi:hypothetical protein